MNDLSRCFNFFMSHNILGETVRGRLVLLHFNFKCLSLFLILSLCSCLLIKWFSNDQLKLSLDCNENNQCLRLVFYAGFHALFSGPQIWKNINFVLKLGPMILFIHLKIILL